MALKMNRSGVRSDQVDTFGRLSSKSFFKKLLDRLPVWVDLPVWKGGTEQLLPVNDDEPETSPILADIDYPDILREDQYFTYRESPTEVDGTAHITGIRGNTLVWNQLANPSNYFSSLFRATKSISGNTVTLTDNRTSSSDNFGGASLLGRTIPVGHKVLVSFNIVSLNITDFYRYSAYLRNSSGGSAGSSTTYLTDTGIQKVILTATAEANQFAMNFYTSSATTGSTDTTVIKDIMVFDLTAMGLDITYPSDFTSLFPLSYYQFDSGSLLSFNGTGIKTTGKNLLPNIKSVQNASTIVIGGSYTDYYIYLQGGMTYTITKDVTGSCSCYMRGQNQDTINLIPFGATKSASFVAPMTDMYRFWLYRGSGITESEINYFQLEIGSSATEYEPYTTQTTDLPISTYFPTGMKSVGTVYDELVPTKATTRIGAVDLGTLDWYYVGTGNTRFWSEGIKNLVKIPTGSNVAKILCVKYPDVGTAGQVYDGNKQIAIQRANEPSSGQIWIRDTNYNDASAFKTAMDGVYLYYELATEVVEPTMVFE